MKFLKSIFFYIISIATISAQCPDLKQIKKDLSISGENRIELERLKTWDYQWGKCNFPIDSLYGILNYRIAETYFLNQNNYESLLKFKKALEIFKKYDTKISFIPKTLSMIARCHYYLKQNNEAKDFFLESIRLANNPAYNSTLAQNYIHLSSINYEEGDFQVALKNIENGIAFAKKSNNYAIIANAANQQAVINNFLGNYEIAQSGASFALKNALITKNNELIARQYQMKARIYANQKLINEAASNYQNAIDVLGNDNLTVSTSLLINIGFLYLNKVKDYDKSITYFEKALKIAEDPFQKLRIFNNIGYAYSQKKDYGNAFLNYQNGFQAISSNFNSKILANNPSSELVKRASNKEYLLTLTQDKADTWKEFYLFNKNQENLKNALSTYLVYSKMIDFMRWEHKGEESKFYWREKTKKVYENAIETCLLLKDYEHAFYFFEKSRAVLLNDKLNESGAKNKLSEQERQKEADLQSKIEELRRKLSQEKNKSEKVEKELFFAETEQDRFIKSLETKNPAYYQIKYDTTIVSLKQFQKYLSSFKGQAVEYFIGDAATYAIVVSPNSVSIKKLNYNTSNTQQFLDFCSKSINTKTELSQYLSLSTDIYRSLIQPLNLQKGRLIISQDGAFMPFEALSKSANKNEYLVHDFKISYTYSAQFLLRNQQNSTFLPQNKFLGIAPVNYNLLKLSSLEGSDESLNTIANKYFWSSKYVDKEASKKAFLVNAKKHQIVQIYTHAFADSNDTEPRIYFADTTLKVSELNSEEQFKTNLLVLSACKTGVGKVAKGEGVLSLARGFSMVGIPATITSLWSIEDKDTYKLTELFYQYLNQGLPKDEALQQAKINFIESSDNPMPNTWAGMILIGDSSAISSNYWYVWLLAGFVITAIAGIWYLRKRMKASKI